MQKERITFRQEISKLVTENENLRGDLKAAVESQLDELKQVTAGGAESDGDVTDSGQVVRNLQTQLQIALQVVDCQ